MGKINHKPINFKDCFLKYTDIKNIIEKIKNQTSDAKTRVSFSTKFKLFIARNLSEIISGIDNGFNKSNNQFSPNCSADHKTGVINIINVMARLTKLAKSFRKAQKIVSVKAFSKKNINQKINNKNNVKSKIGVIKK